MVFRSSIYIPQIFILFLTRQIIPLDSFQKDYLRPLHVERLNGEFVLCYDEFSFFVNRNGWHVSSDWKVIWKGIPKSISVSYPYILAFGLDSVEIWHIETGKLLDIIVGHQIRLLHSHIGKVRKIQSILSSIY